MMPGLFRELIFLILQFLNEENYKEAAHRLESESGVYFNVNYIEELVIGGDWDNLEKYLAGFIRIGDNPDSVKMLFEICKQKYLEALEKNERAKALDILNEELKVFKPFNEELFSEMTNLLTVRNSRQNAQLSDVQARKVLFGKLKTLIESNPDLREKCRFPNVKKSRLRTLVDQSLNWQRQLCHNRNFDPDITSILVDHTSGPQNVAQGQVPEADQFSSILRSGGLQLSQLMHPHEVPIYRGISSHAHNHGGENQLVSRRSRSFGLSNEIRNLPTPSATLHGQINANNLFAYEDLPTNVISTIDQGSDVTSMDFHPKHETLLAVGTNNGDISIWEIGRRLRVGYKMFIIWNVSTCSRALQASLINGIPAFVTRVLWSPDGLFLGVAYSKNIVQIYSYRTGHELGHHLEIEAHTGNVNDIAFFYRDQRLHFITCGQDTSVKVWDVLTGVNQRTLMGHDAPVYSVCVQSNPNVQAADIFIYTMANDGKTKVWAFYNLDLKIEYDLAGYSSTRMSYSTDGLRLFSCGSGHNQEPYLVEWNEGEGKVKQNYLGLGKHYAGVVKFDTTNRFLAAADDFTIKFWNMDDKQLLYSTDADGGLPACPCIRFNKDGTLLAVSTNDHGIKILGNLEGSRIVKNIRNQPEGRRVASGSASRPLRTSNNASSSAPRVILALPASTSIYSSRNSNMRRRRTNSNNGKSKNEEKDFN